MSVFDEKTDETIFFNCKTSVCMIYLMLSNLYGSSVMKVLKTLKNYFFYCGIEKDEYNSVKKDAYISNFNVWKLLHFLMTAVFGVLFISSLFSDLMSINRMLYSIGFLYSVVAVILFFILKKDSLVAQLLIYLSISTLFLISGFIAQNKPEFNSTTFIVLLLVTPMFMIDKPFFMAIELGVASAIFLIWMYNIKTYSVWVLDFVNVTTFMVVGVFLNVIANSIRIKEFVLAKEIIIQKDTDELTGLKNKGALARGINEFLADETNEKGMMFILDIDRFKFINDSFGHDVGDIVIQKLGVFLGGVFTDKEIVGRFGGDEFIVFIKDIDDLDKARTIADYIVDSVSKFDILPDNNRISVSIGIAVYSGVEKNYSDLLKKADIAMYRSKVDPINRVNFYD